MNRRTYNRELLAAALAAISLACGQEGRSQPSAATTVEADVIEEILVTAQRREQAMSDVSIAVSALDGDDIVGFHMSSPAQLVQHIPTLQFKSVFSRSNPQIFLRGAGVNDDTALTSGSVAIYSDEVLVGAPAGQLFPLFDLERIEVLRGPQGTLYGRNTTGGAINFISRQPGDSLETMLRIGAGRFGERTFEGALGGPLSTGFGGRLAMISSRRDGYMHNDYLGTRDAATDYQAARGLLRYDGARGLSWILKAHGGRNDAAARQFKSQGLFDPASIVAGAPLPCRSPQTPGTCSDLLGYVDGADPHSGQWDRRANEEIDVAGASLRLTAAMGELELTSISAYESTDRRLRPDTDGSPNQVLHIDWIETNEQLSQELRLASQPEAGAKWLAGVYLLDQEISIDQTNDAFRELRSTFGFDPTRLIFTVDTQIGQSLRSYAAFGQVDVEVGERFVIVGGLRYTSEERNFDRLDAIVEPGFTVPLVQVEDSVRFGNLSGKLALEFTDQRGNLAYASLSSGFKSGGFNGAVALDPDSVPPFDEETAISLELGYKWTTADSRLRINTAGFYTDYADLQVFTRLTSGGIPREILTNAADASALGLEVELAAVPVDGTELRLGLGLLDTELKDYRTDIGQDHSGNDLVGAPSLTANGMLRREIPLGSASLALQASVHYQDRVFFETSNDPLLAQDGYWLAGARISLRSSTETWELALWGENLLDERYLAGVVGLGVFGYNLQSWGEPRTWGVELIWNP